MEQDDSKQIEKGKKLYILEATLEYLISILVTGSFLATLTRELGMSDSLTGILSSIISLGCLFQLMSIGLRRKKVKMTVLVLSIINQFLFTMLYVISFLDGAKNVKIMLFVIFICLAYIIYNFAHPKKINWLMSLIDDAKRGEFTANKEIVSLIVGMIFTFAMGSVSDYYAEKEEIRTAFIISALVLFVLMLSHSACLIMTVEKPMETNLSIRKKTSWRELLEDKNILKVTVIFVLYYVSMYVSSPYYGTYQINELGFSLKYVSLLVILGNIARLCLTKFWGRYADKKSFAAMIEKCFYFLALSQICAIFSIPANGTYMFLLYYIFQGIALGGVNSALINLVFDYVVYTRRADSLAICQAASGTVGFFSTLCVSPLVTHIQNNGNEFMGIHVYAQQVVSVIGLIFSVFAIIYVKKVIGRNVTNK